MDCVYEERAKGAFVRSRRRWLVEGKNKKTSEYSYIHKLNIDGKKMTTPKIFQNMF
jgi:hypothetical protein